jgi:hypothetical protein
VFFFKRRSDYQALLSRGFGAGGIALHRHAQLFTHRYHRHRTS